MQTAFCQLKKQEVSASKNMLMQPKLELTFQGLPETVLASDTQNLRNNKWNFQNIAKVALRGLLKSNTKKKIPSKQGKDECVAINQDR